jgi:autotransporter-associated beta strand protein
LSGIWDIATTANWIELSTTLAATYADGNAVLFNDSASGTTSVNLDVTVKPAKVTVNNTKLKYSLSGSGKISGATGLIKQGPGSLALNNTNDYTGVTRIEGGTVSVTNLANGGQPSAIGSSSSAANNLVLAGGTLSYAGPAVVVDRGYSVQGANSTINVQSDLGLSGPVSATAGSGFVKTGPAILTHLGAGVKELSGGAGPGYRIEAGTVLFDGTGGAQTNHTQNDLWVGNTINQGADLILSNTVLNVDNWVSVGRGNGPSDFLSTATLYNSTLRSGNFSMGYDNNIAGNLARQTLTLNGTSSITNASDMNLGESGGSTSTIQLNDNSILFSDSRIHLGWHAGGVATMTLANSSTVNVDAWFSVGHEGGTGSRR